MLSPKISADDGRVACYGARHWSKDMLFRIILSFATAVSAANLIALKETDTLRDLDLTWWLVLLPAFALIWISLGWARSA